MTPEPPPARPVHLAGIGKKLAPGQPGTKRHLRQFGTALVCVRYRLQPETARRYTTVEIIVDEKRLARFPAPDGITDNTVAVTIGHLEKPLIRHSRAGGSPVKSRNWIPAFAGITGFSRCPIAFGESELRQRAEQAGAKWDQDRKVWLLPYGTARQLGLHGRIKKMAD